ncbi:MAG: hypothetical protein ABIP55_15530, partial [Tepidisphaeraceae bacterium]
MQNAHRFVSDVCGHGAAAATLVRAIPSRRRNAAFILYGHVDHKGPASMLSHGMKVMFYRSMGFPMRANGWIWRTLRTPNPAGSNGMVKVHLGPGQGNYLDGWVNVDANFFTARIDLWADFRNPLPFRDG